MSPAHDRLVAAAKYAADKLHSDMSVSLQQLLDSLEGLREHIDELISCVKASQVTEPKE